MGALFRHRNTNFSSGQLQITNENDYHLDMSDDKQSVSRNSSRVPLQAPDAALVRTLPSEELFRSARQVLIRHAGSHYCLRITQHGKLILTK